MRITVVRADITAENVDAVVNAANNGMRGGGGVDGAIHRAGGPAVLADCVARFPHGLATGDAGWTTAGDLPARWVIHTVGPNRHAGETDRALLVSCYRRCLEVAEEIGARTVAFPLVGAGVYGWSVEESAGAALEAFGATSTGGGPTGGGSTGDGSTGDGSTGVEEARFVAFSDAAYDVVAGLLAR